jgi:hypothetical protein
VIQLETLADIEAIKQLKARQCRLVDMKQWDEYRDLLTEDVVLDSEAGVYEGSDAVVAMVSSALAEATTVHQVFAPEITVSGDRAAGIWAMEDYVTIPAEGGTFTFHGYGHYREEYARSSTGWRIRRTTGTRLRVDVIEGG